MRKISSSDLKQIELDILKDVAEYCDTHGLRYFLAFGTLLGAVRHKGFIPWDDDIDIAMPYEDYQQFISQYNHPYYYVNSIEKDKGYHLLFAKVYDARTSCLEYDNLTHVWIDIFPIIGVPSNEPSKRIFIKTSLLLRTIWTNIVITSKEPVLDQSSLYKSFRSGLAKIVNLLIPRTLYVKIILWHFGRGNSDDSNLCFNIGRNSLTLFSSSFFSETSKAEFEGILFNIPVDYDGYLNACYGDYMTLPPEDQRITHSIEAFWND